MYSDNKGVHVVGGACVCDATCSVVFSVCGHHHCQLWEQCNKNVLAPVRKGLEFHGCYTTAQKNHQTE